MQTSYEALVKAYEKDAAEAGYEPNLKGFIHWVSAMENILVEQVKAGKLA